MYEAPTAEIQHIELNTVCKPRPGFMDESNFTACERCGNRLRLSYGMGYDPVMAKLTDKHIELCTGEIGSTLRLIQEWFREGGAEELVMLQYAEEERDGHRHKAIVFQQDGQRLSRPLAFDLLLNYICEVTE